MGAGLSVQPDEVFLPIILLLQSLCPEQTNDKLAASLRNGPAEFIIPWFMEGWGQLCVLGAVLVMVHFHGQRQHWHFGC